MTISMKQAAKRDGARDGMVDAWAGKMADPRSAFIRRVYLDEASYRAYQYAYVREYKEARRLGAR